jgi:hypothetical protein
METTQGRRMKTEKLIEKYRASRELLIQNWIPVLILIASVSSGLQIADNYSQSPPMSGGDPMTFEYAGWQLAEEGEPPYESIFDVKTPLVYTFPGLLALLSLGNPMIYHALAVIFTSLAAISSIVIAGLFVYRETESEVAGLITGLSMISITNYITMAALGIRAKQYVILFGVLSLYLYSRESYKLSGLTAAFSAGFYQFGIIFALILLGRDLISERFSNIKEIVIGGFTGFLITVLPVMALGAGPEMINQSVLAVLNGSDTQTLFGYLSRIYRSVLHLRYGIIILGIAAISTVTNLERTKEYWWIPFGLTVFAIKALFIDLDAEDDIFILMTFASLATGLIPTEKIKKAIVPVLLFTAITSGIFLGGYNVVYPAIDDPYPTSGLYPEQKEEFPLAMRTMLFTARSIGIESTPDDSKYNRKGNTDMWDLILEKRQPDTCHIRMGDVERKWLEKTNQTQEDPCMEELAIK